MPLYNQPFNNPPETVEPAYFLILGPAGSGVTTALDIFSNFGFLQIGDVKPDDFLDLFETIKTKNKRIALSIGVEKDQTNALNKLCEQLEGIKATTPAFNVLCLDAPESELVKRYMDSNKSHPCESLGLEAGVKQDKENFKVFKTLKQNFPNGYYSVDTSTHTTDELKLKIGKILGLDCQLSPMNVQIKSFGYKHGIPKDAEMVFDMRFIKNPYYDDALRPLTGLDQPVKEYVYKQPAIKPFMENWFKLLETVIPAYHQEGKLRLSLAVGCTGGQHRSVCMAEALASHLKMHFPSYNIKVTHRETAHWPSAKETV